MLRNSKTTKPYYSYIPHNIYVNSTKFLRKLYIFQMNDCVYKNNIIRKYNYTRFGIWYILHVEQATRNFDTCILFEYL